MNLIKFSILRPVFAWMLMTALIVFGAIGLSRMGVSQMPDVDFPVISISVSFEGAAPEVVEAELIDPLEQSLLGIEGIEQMKSSVRQGGGSITLDFNIDRNIDVALQEVQTALSSVRLPTGIDPPVVRKRNPEESPIIYLGIATDRPLREAITWVETYLLDQFRFLPGIGEVSIGGFSDRNLRIWPDLQKLKKADLTVTDIADALESQHLESAAGQYSDGQRELRVRWMGEATTPEEVGQIKILRRGGQIIQDRTYRIQDVAEVEDGLSDIRRVARIGGTQAISVSIQKQRGGNEVALAESVRQRVESLQTVIPEDIKLNVNVDFTIATKAVVDTTYQKLIIAALVTILICFLFLGSFQAALNILFSIPTSIVGTFIILYFAGFTLNLFTLLALTLAISIVVDDAIMILENIVRHYRMGKTPYQAAYDGSIEILPAATAATLAVVAVFLPVVFMDGITGKFFFQFGVAMSAAVLLSLLEAVTITPMRAAALMATSPKVSQFERWLDHRFESIASAYQSLLKISLRFSPLVVGASLIIFVASLFMVQKVRQEFIPQQDQNLILLSAQTPPGTSLNVTIEKALEIEKILEKNPYIRSFFASVGAGGPSSAVNSMFMPLYLIDRAERPVTHIEIMDQLRAEFRQITGVRVSMRDLSARGLTTGRAFPISFTITGPDLDVLVDSARGMIEKLEERDLAQDLDTDFKKGLPELLIIPNRQAMAERGVTISQIARTLSATVAGLPQSRFTSDGRRYDIRIKLRDEQIQNAKNISAIEVRNQYGLRVPLSELVTFKEVETFQSISRVNRQRAIGVFGNVGTGQSQGAVLNEIRSLARDTLPEGYALSLEGASAGLDESFKSLGFALLLGVIVAYMILATQFNSFIHPFTILVALPFSITGALLVLWLTGVSLNMFSFIGIIVLMGIAKKNSILLVEFTNQVRNRGQKDVKNALLEACPVRLRPILMTSLATIAAAVPLLIGDSIGQETRTPMGLTIIGGMVVSTIFTLVVVPSLYSLLSRFERNRDRSIG
jgi:hydrophobe/amphiphile efflux-1 (HAE1) family protein